MRKKPAYKPKTCVQNITELDRRVWSLAAFGWAVAIADAYPSEPKIVSFHATEEEAIEAQKELTGKYSYCMIYKFKSEYELVNLYH